MKNYPKDSFDDAPASLERVGAHRGPRQKGRRWIGVGWAALATVILAGGGILGLMAIERNADFISPFAPEQTVRNTISEAPATSTWDPGVTEAPNTIDLEQGEVVPIFDGITPVEVRNGSGVAGTAEAVTATLATLGFNMAIPAESDQVVENTVVYYTDESLEAAALGLAENIPNATVELNTDYPAGQMTMVIGSSYAVG